MNGLHVRPVDLATAQQYVTKLHRHHFAPRGHKFSLGVYDALGVLHGVAVVGRPVARLAGHPLDVLEVTRLCTDGTQNACSILYAAAARAGAAMGYMRIQTYTLASEPGTSLRAAGWTAEAHVRGRQWTHTDGKSRRTDQPTDDKVRWSKTLNVRPETHASNEHSADTAQLALLA